MSVFTDQSYDTYTVASARYLGQAEIDVIAAM
jgi:hypothetical protein